MALRAMELRITDIPTSSKQHVLYQGIDVSAAFVAMMFGDENDGRGVCLWLDELALT